MQSESLLEPPGVVTLRIQMRKEDTAPEDGYDVVENRRIWLDSYNRDTIVQTDKPVYKPGQTGKRCFILCRE